jgi:prepilin-type N-terminal cleavage/methylation domain-containing protein
MHSTYPYFRRRPGFTLLEMTIVIMVLLSLVTIGFRTSGKIDEWKAGRAASEVLREVYSAQRTYLADHPTASVASLDNAKLLPYMPRKLTEMPTVKSLGNRDLPIRVSVIPPVVLTSVGGGVYDPSGNPRDMLWDVGEP